LTMI
jgi:hypothetical protein